MNDPSLADLIRHAERFGIERVYETAEEHLPALELGYLVLRLRRVDKHWRLSADERERLIRGLIEAGVPDREIREMARVTLPTLRKMREGALPAEVAA